jgi:hypothetical protein
VLQFIDLQHLSFDADSIYLAGWILTAQLRSRILRFRNSIRKVLSLSRVLACACYMVTVLLFFFFNALVNSAGLALAISSYCMPPSSAANSFHGLCKEINEADALAKCAPGLELLGFGVDVTMCKSYGCRPSIDFDPLFDRKEVNT